MRVLSPVLAWVVLSLPAAGQQGGEVTGNSALAAGRAGAGNALADSLLDGVRNPAALSFRFSQQGWKARDGILETHGRVLWQPLSGKSSTGLSFRDENVFAGGPWLSWGKPLSSETFFSISFVPAAAASASFDRDTILNVKMDTDHNNSSGDPVFDIPIHNNSAVRNDLMSVGLEPNFSWRPRRNLSLGLGASLRGTLLDMGSAADVPIANLQGEVPGLGSSWGDLLTGLLEFMESQGQRPDVPDSFQVDYSVEATAPLQAFLKAGVLWEPSRDWRVGAWARSPSSKSSLEGTAFVDLSADMGEMLSALAAANGLPPDYFGDNTSNFDLSIPGVQFPGQIGISAARFFPRRRERITADVVWTGWGSAFQGWEASLSNPDNEPLGEMIGGDGSTTLDLDMNWQDTLSLSMAWEKDITTLHTFRTGVGWSQNPVGGSPLPGLVPFNRVHLGLGLTRWGKTDGGDWHVSLVAALPETWTTGDNAVLSDFSGDSYTQADYALVMGWSHTW